VGNPRRAEPLVALCEKTGHTLRKRWLNDAAQKDWSPKCDIYLYPSGKEFERLTHTPADGWGFADLAVGEGRVWVRRLHLRSDDAEKCTAVLTHELTHVVLAERFTQKPIPRWADEGMAVLSEPAERQRDQLGWLVEEAGQRRLFGLRDLTRQQDVPRDRRQCDLFYAQSGALVDYLLTEHGLSEARLMAFVEDCDSRGWDATVKKWFPETTTARFESSWKDWLASRHNDLLAQAETSRDEESMTATVID
jgi:hypothetical protein